MTKQNFSNLLHALTDVKFTIEETYQDSVVWVVWNVSFEKEINITYTTGNYTHTEKRDCIRQEKWTDFYKKDNDDEENYITVLKWTNCID